MDAWFILLMVPTLFWVCSVGQECSFWKTNNSPFREQIFPHTIHGLLWRLQESVACTWVRCQWQLKQPPQDTQEIPGKRGPVYLLCPGVCHGKSSCTMTGTGAHMECPRADWGGCLSEGNGWSLAQSSYHWAPLLRLDMSEWPEPIHTLSPLALPVFEAKNWGLISHDRYIKRYTCSCSQCQKKTTWWVGGGEYTVLLASWGAVPASGPPFFGRHPVSSWAPPAVGVMVQPLPSPHIPPLCPLCICCREGKGVSRRQPGREKHATAEFRNLLWIHKAITIVITITLTQTSLLPSVFSCTRWRNPTGLQYCIGSFCARKPM
jgi:hypothetical protein